MEIPPPYDFGIVNWTEEAIRKGLKEDLNKKIEIYTNFGRKLIKVYNYDEILLGVLQERLPIVDLTEITDTKFKIYGTINPYSLFSK